MQRAQRDRIALFGEEPRFLAPRLSFPRGASVVACERPRLGVAQEGA